MSERLTNPQPPSLGSPHPSSVPAYFKEKNIHPNQSTQTDIPSSIPKVCVDLLAHVFTYRQTLEREESSPKNPLFSRFTKEGLPGKEAETKLLQLRDDLLRLQNWSSGKEKKIQAALTKTSQSSEKSIEEVPALDVPSLFTHTDFPDLAALQIKISYQFAEVFKQSPKSPEEGGEFDYTLSSSQKGEKLTSLLKGLQELNRWLNVLQREIEKTLPKREVTSTQAPCAVKQDKDSPALKEVVPASKSPWWKQLISFLTNPV